LSKVSQLPTKEKKKRGEETRTNFLEGKEGRGKKGGEITLNLPLTRGKRGE